MPFQRLRAGQHLKHLKAEDINHVFDILDHIKGEGGVTIHKRASGHWTISASGPEVSDGPIGVDTANNRVAVDWTYDTSDHYIKVKYGTLTLADGLLSIIPDDAWTRVTPVVEENY